MKPVTRMPPNLSSYKTPSVKPTKVTVCAASFPVVSLAYPGWVLLMKEDTWRINEGGTNERYEALQLVGQ